MSKQHEDHKKSREEYCLNGTTCVREEIWHYTTMSRWAVL